MEGGLVRCSRCGVANRAGARFCTGCGQALEVRACPHCGGQVLESVARFCSHCGGRLEIPAAPVTPPGAPSDVACPQCGSRVSPSARFCQTCGRDLQAGVVKHPVAWAPPRSRRLGRWVVLGVLVVLVGVGGLLLGPLKTGVVSLLGGSKVEAIAAGRDHSLALTKSGEVYAWGLNESGQLGLGDKEDRFTPTKVPGLPRVKAIAAGLEHSLALTESGEVYAWGRNEYGELGLGDTEKRLTPTKVPGLGRVTAIAAGEHHSLALTEAGEVYAWGRNEYGQLGVGMGDYKIGLALVPTKVLEERVTAIAAGEHHSLALTEAGEVYAWGWNEYGQLGVGTGDYEEIEVAVRPMKVPGLGRVTAIAAGWFHSLALTEAGEVYAWGWNELGQLGLGDTENRLTPTKVPELGRVTAIAAGGAHCLALTEAGEVYVWGVIGRGVRSRDSEQWLTPTKVPGLPRVKAIAAGGAHCLALTEAGEVYTWGDNGNGQLGLRDTKNRLTPTKVPGLAGVKAIEKFE